MTIQEKVEQVDNLYNELSKASCFYIANSEGLSVSLINEFRKRCFEKGIKYKIIKNTLIRRALVKLEEERKTEDFYNAFSSKVLKGASGILILEEASGIPAKILKSFHKDMDLDLPLFKGAYVDGNIYIGSDYLEELSTLKSRKELIGNVITLLQSPLKNILSALDSGKNKLSGLLKTLSNR